MKKYRIVIIRLNMMIVCVIFGVIGVYIFVFIWDWIEFGLKEVGWDYIGVLDICNKVKWLLIFFY